MMSERDIFIAALQKKDTGERQRYVNEACAGQPELREQVETLLRLYEGAGSFLQNPAMELPPTATLDKAAEPTAPVDPPVLTERQGSQIGPYKLIEQLGEGGFGIVFRAEQQQPIRRTVALKVLKPGMDTRQVIARFEAERQALAVMDHQNIARVIDGGETRSGRPYFVMDLVKGIPITRFCDEQKLTVRQRLELFVPACRAVQHAHQKGIIHRDLKPTNVLVAAYDGKPVPKIIDFGVAKALGQQLTERTLATRFGEIIGTLEYMSPEQAEFNALDVDTRADVYSLGVLLYELLTGTTPLSTAQLKQAGVAEVLRLIREEDPPTPSTRLSNSKESLTAISAQRKLEPARLAREVRGDLDWIVMRCLEKDRARRYQTANDLARDIERYLNEEPVEAGPPSPVYRLRKFARKNRKWLAAATAFVLLLVTGTGVSAWQAVRARTAEREAVKARDSEADQLRQAKKSEARAQAVLKFFQDKVLAAPRPKNQEGGLRKDATIREALDQAEPAIAKSFADDPLLEASIRNTLGVSYWYLGAHDLALRQQERALQLRRQELGPDHQDTVGIMNDLGIIFHSLGKFREAEKLFAETVEVKRRTLGPEHPITLRSVNNLAVIQSEQGRYEDASKLAKETWEIQKRVDGPETIFTLRSAYNVAIMWRCQGRMEDARRLFDETLETLRRVHGTDHQDTLRVMNYLGELLVDQGKLLEAQKLFEQTLEKQRGVLGETNDETILTLANLADTLRGRGQLKEARKLAEQATQLHRRVLGPEHPQALVAQTFLANVLRDQGEFSEAVKLYERTLMHQRPILGSKTPETQRLLNEFAWLLATASDLKFRDPPRAVALAKEAVENAPSFGDKWKTLGVAYYRVGDWKSATAAFEKSESLAAGRFTGVSGFFQAMAHWQLGEKEKARDWYTSAVAWMQKHNAADPELIRFRAEAANLLRIADSKSSL
jgi:serine/threonine protein kinase/Tfp pilus assembly protein PilF